MEQRIADHIIGLRGVRSFPVTTSVYDMGDRRTEVNHPASGITSFTCDPLGNVLTKQTANMTEDGKMITYGYDHDRLTEINYPDHPENNVRIRYGSRNAGQGCRGRVMLREDGSGAEQYSYGRQGEVTRVTRTLIVPGQGIMTYETRREYDSFNRLLSITYPDAEKVSYGYDIGGMLESVTGQKTYTYPYITEIGYDRFGQRSYMKHGNGAVTCYGYDDVRRLCHLDVTAGGNRIIDNDYSFDPVGNVMGVTNNAPLPGSGSAGGRITHTYGYDTLYRLSEASGQYTTAGGSAGYLLSMTYDAMHRITRKEQSMTRTEAGAAGALEASYTLDYGYSDLHPFRLGSVEDISERKDAAGRDRSNAMRHRYEYDPDGNLTRVRTSLSMKDGTSRDGIGERRILWDEENRMLAYSDNGFVSGYWYDAGGMRTVKTSGAWSGARIDGEYAAGSIDTTPFTLYVSPELVWSSGGHYTKHIYAGGERVVSKVGDGTSYGTDPRDVEKAGCSGYTVDWSSKAAALRASIAERYDALDVPYEGPAPAATNAVVARAAAMTAEDGDDGSGTGNDNLRDEDDYEKLQFFYHPDHLGSSNFITSLDGEVVQHIEYVPFGEVFIDERNSVWNTPYLFNAKEFDEETGMYYYGARYYDPRLSLWMSTDPMELLTPDASSYRYLRNNPLRFIDPTGLFDTDSEALQYANENFPGAEVHRDTKSGLWFISLNEEKNRPYVSGSTLTRDFGPNNPYADNDDNNFLKGTVTGLSAFGVANSAKENLIEQTAKSALKGTANEGLSGTKAVSKAFGKDVGRYFKYVKGAGVAGAAVSSGMTVYSAADYYRNGGTSLKVGAKATLDVTMTAIGFCGPIGFGVSAAYFLFDVSFGDKLWNIPNENQINNPMPESKP